MAKPTKPMKKAPAKQSEKKTGALAVDLSISCVPVRQGDKSLYVFSMAASKLWSMVSINRRDPDKNEGYQRVLPNSRVKAVASYIAEGNLIPNSVLVAFDKAEFDPASSSLLIPAGDDVGWVIDGQHRLAGAHEAFAQNGIDYEIVVIALLDTDEDKQVEYFVTINREAKGVPTSLVLDLLNRIPRRKPGDVANERAADIATELRKDKNSPLFSRIVIDSPSKGQISLVNFVRKVNPLVHQQTGRLRTYTLEQQKSIISNYFIAIKETYSEEWRKENTIFFRTVGFGALFNVFERIFNECVERYSSFTPSDIKSIIGLVADFDFGQWSEYGSGNKAENDAATDFLIDFDRAINRQQEQGKLKQLKL
jgi:DGQHR domain-containing protein